MTVGPLRLAACVAVAAGLAARLPWVIDGWAPEVWRRENYRGATVSWSAGPAVATGLLGAMAAGGAPSGALVAVAGAAAAGWHDDRVSQQPDERAAKGFAGHLSALRRGKASAGVVKMALIGASSLAAAAMCSRDRGAGAVDTVLDGCLVAGSANLANLLDLRPGRALKVAGLLAVAATPGVPVGNRPVLAAAYGVVAAALPGDLAERTMLGDTGANAVGAAIGSTLIGRGRGLRIAVLAGILGLTALSEKVSFTAVIAGNPMLRRLDELGRAGG